MTAGAAARPAGRRSAPTSPHGDPAAVTAVAEGRAGVQDEASQLAALALARVGVGGPTTGGWTCAPARAARRACWPGWRPSAGARLVAAELREHRARLVRSAITPAGSGGVVVADGTMPAWRPAALTG